MGRRHDLPEVGGGDAPHDEGSARSAASGALVVASRVVTVPNALSLLRLATVPVFLWLFLSGRENAAVVLYGASALTDFLDGVIARRFDQISELGKLIDPLSDRVLIIALAIALVGRGTLPVWLAGIVLLRDVVVLSAFPALERRGVTRIAVNVVGKTATACLFIGLTSLALSETTFFVADVGQVVGMPFTAAGAVLYWIAGAMYGAEALKRLRERPARRQV